MIPVLFTNTSILKHYGQSYTVTPILFRGSTPQITAMAAGEIDVGVFAPPALALASTNAHLDVKVLADVIEDGVDGYHSDAWMVPANSPILKIEDLKGKRVATNAIGSSMDTAMRVMLLKHDLQDPRDFSSIEASFSSMPAILEEGKVDMAPILQPYQIVALKQGKLRVLFTNADAVGPSQTVFLVARADFLAAHKQAVLDFFEDYVRASRWFHDPKNHDQAIGIIANFMKQPPANLQYLFTKVDYYRDPYMVPNVPYIQSAIDAAVTAGALKQPFTVAPDHVDLSYIEAAKARVQASEGSAH